MNFSVHIVAFTFVLAQTLLSGISGFRKQPLAYVFLLNLLPRNKGNRILVSSLMDEVFLPWVVFTSREGR